MNDDWHLKLQDYRNFLTTNGLSENSVNSYLYTLGNFAQFMVESYGQFDYDHILSVDIKDYQNYLLNIKKYKPATISKNLVVLRNYCQFLIIQGYMTKNPCDEIPAFKVQNPLENAPEVLEGLHLKRFRRAVYAGGSMRDICIYELLYNTGIRVSELCAIELDDFVIGERSGTLIVRSGKGNKYREVPLNAVARASVRNYLEIRPKVNNNKLLQGQRGPLQRKAINTILNKYAAKVDIGGQKMHPHLLRHQFGHDMVQNGETLSVLKEILGHENINTTARYTKPTKKDTQEAVERLNQ